MPQTNDTGREKRCPKCGVVRSLADFGHDASRKDGHSCHCKPCRKATWRAYVKSTEKGQALKRRSDLRAIQKRRDRIAEAVKRHKADTGCAFCGERDPVCLDLHHVDPATKTAGISRIQNEWKSWSMLEVELAKCVVICANCHRKVHAGKLVLPPPEEAGEAGLLALANAFGVSVATIAELIHRKTWKHVR